MKTRLKLYIEQFPTCERMNIRHKIADFIGFSKRSIDSLENGYRRLHIDYANKMEKATGGFVQPHHLYPDLFKNYKRTKK